MKTRSLLPSGMVVVGLLANPCSIMASNGYFLHGVGAVNDSLGGAAAGGNVQDVIGSLHRNPANGTLFNNKMASVSLGAIFPDYTVYSSVDALGLNGSTDSEVDIIPCANLGMVWNDENSPTAYYLAVISEAGLHADLPTSTTNPILIPQAGKPDNPFGVMFGGLGAVEAQVELIRIPLGISHQVDEKWSVGFSVAPSIQRMKFTPGVFAAPDDANGDTIRTYPDDLGHDIALGIGFQVGVNYQAKDDLRFGFSFTSPTWFEEHEWDVRDELGNNREISTRLNRPMSVRLGSSYQLTPDTLLLLDAEWINYSDTEGFDKTGFAPEGALKGLGWDDAWTVSLGVQQDLSDDFIVRAGYSYCSNPIDEDVTFFNVGSPLHTQHHLALGMSYRIFKETFLDIGYSHAFKSTQSSPFYTPHGAAPGTEVETELAYDQIAFSITFPFEI